MELFVSGKKKICKNKGCILFIYSLLQFDLKIADPSIVTITNFW